MPAGPPAKSAAQGTPPAHSTTEADNTDRTASSTMIYIVQRYFVHTLPLPQDCIP
jgi:hypothetical protein